MMGAVETRKASTAMAVEYVWIGKSSGFSELKRLLNPGSRVLRFVFRDILLKDLLYVV